MTDETLFDSWTHDYAMLGLRMDRMFPGTVDAWIGPPEWRDAVNAEKAPRPHSLLGEAQDLQQRLPQMGYDTMRVEYLSRQIAALRTQAEIASGTDIPFAEQARRFLDIEPQREPETTFDEAHAELQALLPGTGSLTERMTAWRKTLEFSGDQISPALADATDEVRRRTRQHLSLPDEERVDIELVQNKPWGAYNWYLGSYRSLIQVNTDLPRPVTSAPDYMAHEGYPGHHVEHILREHHQYRGQGHAEYAILLINTPESVISEAIATCAREIIFPDDEDLEWLASDLLPRLGFQMDVQRASRIRAAAERLGGVGTNAAFMLHEDGRSPEDVADYVSGWSLLPIERARKSLEFTEDPLWRVYPFTYRNGRQLLRPLVQGSERFDTLHRVCTEPVYPARLAEWGRA